MPIAILSVAAAHHSLHQRRLQEYRLNCIDASAAFAPGDWGWMAALALRFGVLEETRKMVLHRRSRPYPRPYL